LGIELKGGGEHPVKAKCQPAGRMPWAGFGQKKSPALKPGFDAKSISN
jgi:hypothetical protein